ncbi:hypothetical protein HKD37_04G010073 [Glycine soja]
MASPPASPPLPPPSPSDALASPSAMKRTQKASRLRSLSTRPASAERPVVHVDPATGKSDGPHRKKLRTYLWIVARDKVDVMYENWKEVPTAQKDLIWEDIQAEFEIPEASDNRTKKKLLARDGGSLNQTSRGNGPLQPIRTDVRKKAQAIQKQNIASHVLSRGGYEYLEQKLLAEKTKKKLEEAAQSGSIDGVIDPPSPVRRHVKWTMACTKKIREMTTEAAKEIAEKIVSHFQLTVRIIFQYFVNAMYNCVFFVQDYSFEEQATQGSFVPHGRQDVLTAAIGRPEHPGRVRAAGAGVTIKQYFGSAPRMSHSSSSLPPEELQQLTQQIRDQLEESITEKVTQQLMASFSQMQSHTKESCVDPSGNNPEMGDSDRCGLYTEANPARLVALGRVYEGSIVVHNTPLLPCQVKVGVEEVKDPDAPVPVSTNEVSLVGQEIHTFLAWPTHLVKSLSQQVNDPLYLMTLTIPELFLSPYQVTWDATVFGVFNPDFPLYIKHKDLSKVAHGGQCLSISVLQLWILHLTETSMRAGNSDIYGFLEPQPDNYLKGILNSALKGFDDAPQPKSKAPARWIIVKCNRQKGSTECGYYVMHWMSTIILGSFMNNWEAYFNDPRPLEPERLKAIRIQWAQYYLQVRAQS